MASAGEALPASQASRCPSSGPTCKHSPLELPGCWSHIFLSVPLTLALKAITISSLICWFVCFFSVLPFYFLTFFLANSLGFPGDSEDKESVCKAGDPSFIPRLQRSSGSCCSVAQSCPTLCNLMDCSMPGFPVLHHLLEPAQTHVH